MKSFWEVQVSPCDPFYRRNHSNIPTPKAANAQETASSISLPRKTRVVVKAGDRINRCQTCSINSLNLTLQWFFISRFWRANIFMAIWCHFLYKVPCFYLKTMLKGGLAPSSLEKKTSHGLQEKHQVAARGIHRANANVSEVHSSGRNKNKRKEPFCRMGPWKRDKHFDRRWMILQPSFFGDMIIFKGGN